MHTTLRFFAALPALLAAALISLPAPQALAAGGDSTKIPKATGTLQTTPPPEGADVLFDGTEASREKWDAVRNRNGAVWPIKNGVWVVGGTDIKTKKEYGACQLHLEWRVPVDRKINGQKGGNSGVIFMYPKGWYEIQILESHSNPGTYADGMAGAIYNRHPPLVNPSLPQGEWQSYDITFTPPKFNEEKKVIATARVHVVYNGVVVQDNRELTGTTQNRGAGFKYHPARMPFALQDHGDPIEFRNIWIKDLEK
jgi:hypothetical protein